MIHFPQEESRWCSSPRQRAVFPGPAHSLFTVVRSCTRNHSLLDNHTNMQGVVDERGKGVFFKEKDIHFFLFKQKTCYFRTHAALTSLPLSPPLTNVYM